MNTDLKVELSTQELDAIAGGKTVEITEEKYYSYDSSDDSSDKPPTLSEQIDRATAQLMGAVPGYSTSQPSLYFGAIQ